MTIPEEARLMQEETEIAYNTSWIEYFKNNPLPQNKLDYQSYLSNAHKEAHKAQNQAQLEKAIPIITKQAQKEATAYYAEMLKKAITRVREKAYKQAQEEERKRIVAEGWELQDKLLAMTVLNQNAPKIVLTNDECGWNISYFPDPPNTEGELSIMKGNPLEAVRALDETLRANPPARKEARNG